LKTLDSEYFFPSAGFIDFIVDPSMQVLGDMLGRIVQSSSQQAAAAASSDHPRGSESPKPGDEIASSSAAANGGAAASAPTPSLPGTVTRQS